jgi:hypothetical protein
MNQVERLREELTRRFPGLTAEIDAPADDQGSWYLDVQRSGDAPPVVVEWRPDRGFGVSTPGGDDYGSGPDEVYPNMKAALDRVVRLVLSGGRTEPPRAVRLAELRQILGIFQSLRVGLALDHSGNGVASQTLTVPLSLVDTIWWPSGLKLTPVRWSSRPWSSVSTSRPVATSQSLTVPS